MNRSSYLRRLSRALGRRRIIYFGTRGADVRSLTDLQNFEAIFSQIAPAGLGGVDEYCLETMTGARVDLDVYNVDDDRSPAVGELRAAMLAAFEGSAAVLAYRSCALLASAWFPRSEHVLHLGNFHDLQSCFEHKPWVETQLAASGIRTVPWRYFADNERGIIEEMLESRPLVVRSNRSDGGTGVRYVASAAELEHAWPEHVDGFLAVAPFLEGVPLNVNGVVFADGSVSRHGVSAQLIGLERCTDRRFGYCGNDFGAAAAFGARALIDIDDMLASVGRWLARYGYRGAFGIDAILAEGGVALVELNPRFQGSSRLSAELDVDDDRADMFLAHIGAFLGAPVPDAASLADLVKRAPRAHVVVHASGGREGTVEKVHVPGVEADLLPEPGICLREGAIWTDLVFREVITSDGVRIFDGARAAVGVYAA